MKCSKCNHEMKEGEKFCPNCGTKVKKQSSFQQKVEAENKQKDHQKKMADKEQQRQAEIIKKKGLKNDDVYISFGFGLVSVLLTFWPAGYDAQLQWWYALATFGSGALGYYFAMRANKKNAEYLKKYRVVVNPKLFKAGIYMSAIGCFGGMMLLFANFVVQNGGL